MGSPKQTADHRRQLGCLSEEQALQHLRGQGLKLVARNYRCRRGELDLIMTDGACLVFVEVRYRSNAHYGGALESVDANKRKKLLAAAQSYLANEPRWQGHSCRFDVVGIDASNQLQWIQDAFQAN